MPHPQHLRLQQISKALQVAEEHNDSEGQIQLYHELLSILPDLAIAHAQVAHLLIGRGNQAEAISHIEQAMSLPSQQQEQIDGILFDDLSSMKYYVEDLERARAWFNASPNLWRFKLLFESLRVKEKYEEAESLLHGMLEKNPAPTQQAQMLNLLSQIYYNQGRMHDSLACCQLGLELTPDSLPLCFNLAVAQEQLGRYGEAMKNYFKILEKDPEHVGTHNNLALLMLRLGQFEDGWRHHEWRWALALKEHAEHFNIPRWNGEPLQGKRLIVWAEQGIGDHIMFASMLPELLALGGTVYYELYARLDPLFTRSFPGLNIIRREDSGICDDGQRFVFKHSWPTSDYQIPAGSLGVFFRPNRDSFPGRQRYLYANAQATSDIKSRYRDLFPGKKLIGISWRGGNSISNSKQLRIIPMHALKGLAEQDNIQLINLQYGNTSEDRENGAKLDIDIYHDEVIDPLVDMDAQAAQICALDAVISVDNTTVHLAGALGIPTYLLLQPNPNWRWGLEEGPSYWYPSVYLIRNREIGRWETALDRAVAAMHDNGHL